VDELRCFCGELILKSYSDTHKTKIRSSILVIGEDGVTKAICRKCGLEHSVPLVLDFDLAKSLQEKSHEQRTFLRKRFAESSPPDVLVRRDCKKIV